MAYTIGLNVTEVDGAGAPAIAGAPVSVAAFNIRTRRGVPNSPARITSFAQFVAQFGGFGPDILGPFLVKGFFDNGGQTAYINRIVAGGGQGTSGQGTSGQGTAGQTTAFASTALLGDDGRTPVLNLTAGYRGVKDPGAWGNGLRVQVTRTPAKAAAELAAPASPTASLTAGNRIADTVDMAAANFPSLAVNAGGATITVPFAAGDFADPSKATPQSIAEVIGRKSGNKLAASVQNGLLVLTAAGSSSLTVTSPNPTLGFTGTEKATISAAPAAIDKGATLDNAHGFTAGDTVLIADSPAHTATATLTQVHEETSRVEWTSLTVANSGPTTFSPTGTSVTRELFDLTVYLDGTGDRNVVETWQGLSMAPGAPDFVGSRLNDPLQGSRYLVADVPNGAAGLPAATTTPQPLAGASDDQAPTILDYVGDPAQRTGFSAFDPLDVQLVCTDYTGTEPGVVRAGLDYCALRGDCMFVGSVPDGYVEGGAAVNYGRKFQGAKVYGALYGPWIKVLDPMSSAPDPTRWIPPTGHILGTYARTESTRGIWKAPAGDQANLAGALDVKYRLTDLEHDDLVRNGSVNGIRAVPGAGIVIDASRTLSTDTRWLYVNVRLLFNYVKSSLKQGLRWVRQEPNRNTLWDAVRLNSVTPFLMGLWRQGAFGTGAPSQVFTVICDATNNSPTEVDLGNFRVEVYFYPSKPAETIIIIVGQQPSGATAAEA